MKVISLQTENFKRLVVAELPLNGRNALITGRNNQGKTSLIDSLYMGLANKGTEDPVRHGAPKTTILLTLGGETAEYYVERTIRTSGQSIKVTPATPGAKPISSPQTFLDGLVGNLAFDPMSFLKLKPKPQAEALREALGIDTSELDAEHKEIFDGRTATNREVDALKARLESMTKPGPGVPAAEVSLAALIEEQSQMADLNQKEAEANRAFMAARDAVVAQRTTYTQQKEAIEKLRAELAQAEKDLITRAEEGKIKVAAMEAADKALTEAKANAPTQEQAQDLMDRMGRLEDDNRAVRHKAQYDALAADLEAKMKESAEATADLASVEADKAALLKKVQYPVEGMTLDKEEGVFVNGIRFDQLSQALQIRTSLAVATAGNPKLRIAIVRGGEALDDENLALLLEECAARDFQLWIERVQSTPGDVGFHIVDGTVAAIDGKPVEPAKPAEEEPKEQPTSRRQRKVTESGELFGQ